MYAVAKPRTEADVLVARHAELVKRIAYHLAGRLPPQVEVEDLVQAGMLGLLEAAAHFTSDRGASFETYAGIRIRGAMLDALRKLDWAPRSVHRKARAAAQALREVENELGGEADESKVAARLGVPVAEYQRIVRDAAACRLLSLEDMTTPDGVVVEVPADPSADPFADVTDDAMRDALVAAIDRLPERERLVMSLYYEQELNLKEIGAVLGVTESRVCQLHGQALGRLRTKLADWREEEDNA
ncbi:MAG TPA: RNA polymerase sigma factor FliA [Steroidobacteraceae bacterium]|nr:RNA polymerase sigma factor FliA [Steroidobacteraceae bacterium]